MFLLSTEHLDLIPLDLYNYQFVRNYYGDLPHFQLYIQHLSQDPDELGFGPWMIIERRSGRMVGDIGYKGKPINKTIDLGYYIIPEARGKGYATEAAKELNEWAFHTGRVHKITAGCYDWNLASARVLEKSGLLKLNTCNKIMYWEIERRAN